MTTTVSIDVEAAQQVIATLRGVFSAAMDEWTAVASAASGALCSTTPLKALSDPLILVSKSADELETRVELAVLYNTGDGKSAPTSGVLTYTLAGADTLENVEQQLGAELARGLKGMAPYGEYLSPENVERVEHYASMLEKYSQDPTVMDGLFSELGPQGVVEIPIMLKDFTPFWATLQQRFMQAYGTGLATATALDSFNRDHPDFAQDMVNVVTESHSGMGWGLSQTLRHGTYDADFLQTLGTGLYDFEIEQPGPVWAPQIPANQWPWTLGPTDDGRYFDPFVGLFEAMSRTPEAAANFFNPDNGGPVAKERSRYMIGERSWQADDFNALGEALDAAATTFHTLKASPQLQEQAAWIAERTVKHLAGRGDSELDPRIGDHGKDSLAHMLATYISDVDLTANDGTTSDLEIASWEVGLPVRAVFKVEHLNPVMGQVLTDDGALDQLATAAAHYNVARMQSGVDAQIQAPGSGDWIGGSVQHSAQLSGFVVGNLQRASVAAGKAVDERNQRYIDLTVDAIGVIPTGGAVTSLIVDQAVSAGDESFEESLTGHEEEAEDRVKAIKNATAYSLQIAMSVTLLSSPLADDAAFTDQSGRELPWFINGRFESDVLDDPKIFDEFAHWASVGGAGTMITNKIPDLGERFKKGYDFGGGS